MTLKIGLTGGIGSGKSQVAHWLQQWGATVIDTDAIAHELTAPGGQAIPVIREQFGVGMITAQGSLDRSAMRELVFAQPGQRRRLEAILHPMIAALALERGHRAQGCYVVFVVPLLIESAHWLDRVDRVCVVDCDPATQIARVRQRSGLTADAIERIMSVQASRAQRLAAADDVIVNDAHTTLDMLRHQARVLHDRWCRPLADKAEPAGDHGVRQ